MVDTLLCVVMTVADNEGMVALYTSTILSPPPAVGPTAADSPTPTTTRGL